MWGLSGDNELAVQRRLLDACRRGDAVRVEALLAQG
jgi:hypothetical protein